MNRLQTLVASMVVFCFLAPAIDPFSGLALASPVIHKESNALLKRACPCTSKHTTSDCLSVPGFYRGLFLSFLMAAGLYKLINGYLFPPIVFFSNP
jgi:hypothetical protein